MGSSSSALASQGSRWGTSSTDPHKQESSGDPFSGEGRYTGLEFCEDPFKNSNYRYGDPFDIENANDDPFSKPFSAPQSDPLDAFGSKIDPFSNNNGVDPFKGDNGQAPKSDPFASAFGPDTSYENSSRIPSDPFASDPFTGMNVNSSSNSTQESSDPFGSSFTATFSSTSPTTDPFHNNNNNKFSSGGNDPFSLTNLRPPPAVPETSSKSTDRVASTTSTVSYRKEKVSSESADPSTSKASLKKKTSHSLSDFLTGSPLKGADKDKEKVKEKKEKKHGKFHISSPLKAHKSKNGESPKSSSKSSAPSDNGVDEVQMKMAAEVSRRSEDERRRKLQLQEEADLAYAIALSKAEAASLKSQ